VDTASGGEKLAKEVTFLDPQVGGGLENAIVDPDTFWDVAAAVFDDIPSREKSRDWTAVAHAWRDVGITSLRFLNLRTLLDRVRGAPTLERLRAEKLRYGSVSGASWIVQTLQLLSEYHDRLPSAMFAGLLPTESGQLVSPEKLAQPVDVSEELKDLSHRLGVPIRDRLVHSEVARLSSSDRFAKVLDALVQTRVDSSEALHHLVQHIREHRPRVSTGSSRTTSHPDQWFANLVKLKLWIAHASPTFDGLLAELPYLVASGEFVAGDSEGQPRFLLPVSDWPEPARCGSIAFPGKRLLDEAYRAECGGGWPQLRDALIQSRVALPVPLVIDPEAELDGSLLKKIAMDGGNDIPDSAVYRLSESSRVPFWNETVGKLSQSEDAARAFLGFCCSYLADADSRWKTAGTATRAGEPAMRIRARSSEWLARCLRDSWVPGVAVDGGGRTASAVHPLAVDRLIDWRSALESPAAAELLALMGFDRLELTVKRLAFGDATQATSIRDELAHLIDQHGLERFREFLRTEAARVQLRTAFEVASERGRAVQALVGESLRRAGKEVVLVDRGYDFAVYERGEVDAMTDLGRFEAGAYLVEVKSTRRPNVSLTPLQAATAASEARRYVLCVVDLRQNDTDWPALAQVEAAMRFVSNIGAFVTPVVESITDARNATEGVSVDNADLLRYRVAESRWTDAVSLQDWLRQAFP
jgi:hypothetical protein